MTFALAFTAMLGASGCGQVGSPGSGGTSSGGNGAPGGQPAPSSQLTASSTSVSFGDVTVGNPSSQFVILTDVGSANVSISGVSASGSGFSATGGQNVTLTPKQEVTVEVFFNPKATGRAQGKLSVSSDAANSPLDLPLSGTGIAKGTQSSQLTASSMSVNFGNVKVGTSVGRQVILTDLGTADVKISSVSATGSGFSATGGQNVMLTPNNSVTIIVNFDPGGVGGAQGNLSISSNASNSVLRVQLSGTGAASPAAQRSVSLAWQPSSSPVIGYFVYRGTSANDSSRLTASALPSTSYRDSTVVDGQTYFYSVTSVDSNFVESSPSNQISVTIPSQ